MWERADSDALLAGQRQTKESRLYIVTGQSLLLAKDLHTLLNGLLGLLPSGNFGATKDQLGDQTPLGRQVPLLGNLGVDQRVIVLQVGTETKSLKASPD